MTVNPNLSAALAYAARGWHVFPTIGKRPAVRRGCHAATTDPATLTRWWTARPDAGIAVACGPSQLLVVDLDRKPNSDGHASLAQLIGCDDDQLAAARMGQLWGTRVHGTPSGGTHLLFRADAQRPVGCTAGRWPGIDTRGVGGYVVAPPTAGYVVELDTDPVAAPSWLVDTLAGAPAAADGLTPLPAVGGDPFAALLASLDSDGDPAAYALAALDGLAADLAAAGPGSRNHTANAVSFRAGRFVGAGVLDGQHAADRLVAAAVAAGLPRREAATAVRSGMAAGVRQPWVPRGAA